MIKKSKNLPFYLLLLPATIYTLIFGYLTMPYMVIAFQRFNFRTGIFNSEWIGLENFVFFIKSNRAWLVTYNTLRLNILFIIFTTLSAIILSILLNEITNRKFAKLLQSTYLFPNFISWIVVSYVVYSFLGTNNGVINNFLLDMGLDKVNWYNKAEVWPTILVIIRVWKNAGMTSVIYLATISGIDYGLYEAAYIDGANRFNQVRYITIPLMIPTVAILTLLSIGRIFYADFGMIYALVGDNGLLFPTTDVIDTYVFRTLRVIGDPSNAMAAGVYQSILGFFLVFGSNLIVRKIYPDGAIY